MIAKWEHPLSLLDEPDRFIAWYREVGTDEANRIIGDAIATAIRIHGDDELLVINDKLLGLIARIQEQVL